MSTPSASSPTTGWAAPRIFIHHFACMFIYSTFHYPISTILPLSSLEFLRQSPLFLGLSHKHMGNYISCALSAPKSKHPRTPTTTMVIFPTGEIRQLNQPIKAAELMFDTPNFFLVNCASLQMGRRFSALNADEDLEMANVYVMFPMKRLNSVVTAADMGALFLTANSAAAKSLHAAQVMPEPAVDNWQENEAAVAKLDLDGFEELLSPEFKHRLSNFRSKKPLLDTIAEEPISFR